MAKMLKFHEQALNSLLKGVKTLSRAVAVTLGPRGRNVMIHRGIHPPLSTKEGATVAKEIILKDKFENMGASLVKEASSKTADIAGDGSTTTIVLAEAILSEGIKHVIAGANPMFIKKGIEKGVKILCEALSVQAKPASTSEEIKQIATISANHDPEIGKLIAQAMEKAGKEGRILVTEGKGIETTLHIMEGMQFDKGYCSPYFITNAEKMSVELENVSILVTDKKLSTVHELVPILEKIMEKEQKPLLIIAEDVEGEALATLIVNKLKGGMPICAVKAPAFGDMQKAILQDIAIVTGATFIPDEVGPEVLGRASHVKVDKEKTTIIGGQGNLKEIKARADQIRAQIEKASSDDEIEMLQGRLAKLMGTTAIIEVGAATEIEMKEKKARIKDALHATYAAALEGIVAGGGVALIRASFALDQVKCSDEERVGVEILKKASLSPARMIANNCGKEDSIIVGKIFENEGAFGYNGLTDSFGDLLLDGVIDPVLVTKSALQSACSIACSLITTSCMITDKSESYNDPSDRDSMPDF